MDVAELPLNQGLVIQGVSHLDLLGEQLLEAVENDLIHGLPLLQREGGPLQNGLEHLPVALHQRAAGEHLQHAVIQFAQLLREDLVIGVDDFGELSAVLSIKEVIIGVGMAECLGAEEAPHEQKTLEGILLVGQIAGQVPVVILKIFH